MTSGKSSLRYIFLGDSLISLCRSSDESRRRSDKAKNVGSRGCGRFGEPTSLTIHGRGLIRSMVYDIRCFARFVGSVEFQGKVVHVRGKDGRGREPDAVAAY